MAFDNFEFPWLWPGTFDYTSPETSNYNCIGWAAGDDSRWWDCQQFDVCYWPVPKTANSFLLTGLQEAYEAVGFEVAADSHPEEGYEKVALYADHAGHWKHAARLLDDGTWTSKMGECEDISHADEFSVSGPAYGQPVVFMRRTRGVQA